MNGLPQETLRTAVAELLVKKIGERWKISSLQEFNIQDRRTDAPRIYYLGKNKITDRLHWIFVNDYYKIVKFDRLQKRRQSEIKTVLKRWNDKNPDKIVDLVNPTIIPQKCALEIIKKDMRDKLILDPSLFLEGPAEPQSYSKDSKYPIIYICNTKSLTKEDRYKNYKEIGFSMIAYAKNSPYFSPYALIDPRSYEPGFWDIILGIEQTIYLPINVFSKKGEPVTKEGVLAISFNEGYDWGKGSTFFKDSIEELWKNIYKETENKELRGKIELENGEVIYRSRCLTEDKAESIEKKLVDEWKGKLEKEPDIQNGIKVLLALFETNLGFYHKYISHFDDYVIEYAISES